MTFLNFILSPTNQRNFTKKIYGFDIETYDNNKKFYCATIYGENTSKTLWLFSINLPST